MGGRHLKKSWQIWLQLMQIKLLKLKCLKISILIWLLSVYIFMICHFSLTVRFYDVISIKIIQLFCTNWNSRVLINFRIKNVYLKFYEARKLYLLSNRERVRIKNIYYVHVYLLQANRITLTAYNVFISTSAVDWMHVYPMFFGLVLFLPAIWISCFHSFILC